MNQFDFENQFIEATKQLQFQVHLANIIRRSVETPTFYHQLWERWRMDKTVRRSVKIVLPNLIDTHLEKVLPGKICTYLPIYLNSNPQFQQALDIHLNNVKLQIQEVTNEEVGKIINEDQYHTINQRYFEAVRKRFEVVSNLLEKDCRDRMKDFEEQRGKLKEYHQKVDDLQKIVRGQSLVLAGSVVVIGGMVWFNVFR